MIWLVLLLAQAAADKAVVAHGEKIFAQSCAVGYCHGAAGEAGRGPRLRGRTFEKGYLDRITREGIPNTAMAGWKSRLQDEDIRAVVVYVESLASAPVEAPPPEAKPPAKQAEGLPEFKGPAQAKRGYALFFSETAGTRCATCHALAGRGNAIGPDLTRLARLNPRGIVVAILASRTQYAQSVKLKSGATFPAMEVAHDDKTVQLYDLSKTPPEMRKVERSDIASMRDNDTWKHPPESAGYTTEQLADIISYIRWASYGDTKGVKPGDLE